MLGMQARLKTSESGILSCHLIHRSLRRQLVWKWLSCLATYGRSLWSTEKECMGMQRTQFNHQAVEKACQTAFGMVHNTALIDIIILTVPAAALSGTDSSLHNKQLMPMKSNWIPFVQIVKLYHTHISADSIIHSMPDFMTSEELHASYHCEKTYIDVEQMCHRNDAHQNQKAFHQLTFICTHSIHTYFHTEMELVTLLNVSNHVNFLWNWALSKSTLIHQVLSPWTGLVPTDSVTKVNSLMDIHVNN